MPTPFKAVEANAAQKYLQAYKVEKNMPEPFLSHSKVIEARVMAFCTDDPLHGSILLKTYIEGKTQAKIQTEPPYYPARTLAWLHERALKAFYPYTFEDMPTKKLYKIQIVKMLNQVQKDSNVFYVVAVNAAEAIKNVNAIIKGTDWELAKQTFLGYAIGMPDWEEIKNATSS